MSHAHAIVEALNYIEDNLEQEISVENVAGSVGYSLYHFSRLFHGVTGSTPGAYLAGRRLTEAANELIGSRFRERNIVDIAFKYQFNSHEGFTRAFKRMFGLRPSDVRDMNTLRHLPRMKKITEEDVRHRTRGGFLEAEVVTLDSFCVAGMTTMVQEDTAFLSEMWGNFSSQVDLVKNKVVPEKSYEIAFWTEDLEGWFSMMAVEVTDLKQVPSSLVGKALPPSRYARFVHKGQSSRVHLTWKYIYETWLPRTKHVLSHPFSFEYYGPQYLGPQNDESESEIYVPIV